MSRLHECRSVKEVFISEHMDTYFCTYASEKHHAARLLDYSVEIVSDTNAKQKAVVHAIIHNESNFPYNEVLTIKLKINIDLIEK